jgi:hypothetical protein
MGEIPSEKGHLYLSPVKTELKDELEGKEINFEEKEKIATFRKVISETANLLSNLNTDID